MPQLRAALGKTRPCYWLDGRPDSAAHPLPAKVRHPATSPMPAIDKGSTEWQTRIFGAKAHNCGCTQDEAWASGGRFHIDKLIGDWRQPEIQAWLRFHKLEQYQKGFAKVTGKVCLASLVLSL